MSTMFSAKKASKKFSKRVLGMESLENRELLSVNPLGSPDFTPSDAVQAATSQNFTTEATITATPTATYHTITITLSEAEQDALKTEFSGNALLQYQKSGDTDSWSTGISVSLSGTAVSNSEGVKTVTLSSLDADQLYQLRLSKTGTDTKDTPSAGGVSTTTTIPNQSTLDPAAAANSFNKVSFTSGGALVVELTGVPSDIAVTDIKFDYTDSGSVSNTTVNPTLSNGKYIYSISGLADGATVTFSNLKIENEIITPSNNTITASVAPTVVPATTNATSSASGVTSNAVTLTWTKPTTANGTGVQAGTQVKAAPIKYVKGTNATDYKITISDGNTLNDKVYYSEGKTTIAIPGLVAGTIYAYKVEVALESAAKASLGTQVVTSGTFKTATEGLGAGVAVGQPTDVKIAPTDTAVKVTWKAPANFTGGYKVTFTDTANSTALTNPFDVFVEAGKKLEYNVTVDSSFSINNLTLKKGDRYEVTVTPIVGSVLGLSSTPTNFVAQKTQSDAAPILTVIPPTAVPATPTDDLLAVTAASNDGITVKLAASKTVPSGVDGYILVAGASASLSTAPATTGVYVTKAQITAGVTLGNLGALADAGVRVFAVNSVGTSTAGESFKGATAINTTAPTNIITEDSTAAITGTVVGTVNTADANKVKVEWTTNDAAIASTATGYAATSYDVYYSQNATGPWVFAGNVLASAALEYTVANLQYSKAYYFAVIAHTNTTVPSTEKFADLVKTSSVSTLAAPTPPTNVTGAWVSGNTAPPAAKKVEAATYDFGDTSISLTLTADTKVPTDGYYIVLRDANKAIIASSFSNVGTSATLSGIPALTPKASYSVEVFGVNGTDVGTKAAKTTLKVADYPAATIKADKPSVNGVTVKIEDKSSATGKFYYVEYTKVADAKGKPDWSTATVEAVTLTDGKIEGYALKEKLDPNTTYYVRVVTADVNVAITSGQWATSPLWKDALSVVYGKEAKVKTAAVPLATVGKPGFGLDATTFNMALKTVGQTMAAGKGAADVFASGKPLAGATFTYTLLVSLDSKVDKNTGQLLGSQAISLAPANIVIRNLLDKDGKVVTVDGEYALTYALTGTGNILDKLGVTAANYGSIKNLNFQLLTTVTYNSGNTTFDSVTKPGKVAMPKAFV